ncbi:hypothetical protein SAMN05428948_4430 [Massilia sp. CF038]|nr:hypothetical protein SAMN05428948_4430 [Massilia sp. CF038]
MGPRLREGDVVVKAFSQRRKVMSRAQYVALSNLLKPV